MKEKVTAKKIAVLSILTALAIISFLVESAFPPLFPYMPYAKLGVANIFIFLAIFVFGMKWGIVVAIGKLLLSTLITGNIYGCLYSACGLTLAMLCIGVLQMLKKLNITVVGKSIVSSIAFNVGQVLFASLSLSTSLINLVPIMIFCSIISGSVIGIAVRELARSRILDWI